MLADYPIAIKDYFKESLMKQAYYIAILSATVILFSGCATTGKGPSDEERIQMTLDQWSAGLVEQDMNKFLGTISESFKVGPAESKEALAEFIRQGIEAGYLDGAEVSREEAQYTLEESSCSVYPVDLMSNAGSVSVELRLTKEEGGWLVSGMEVDGL